MPAEPPFGLVDHFGKNQGRAHAVQHFRAVKNLISGGRPGDVDIDKKLARAPLRHDARSERIAPSRRRRDFDLGKFFLKSLRYSAKLAVAFEKIKRQRAFLLRGFNCLFPFLLPGGLGLSAEQNSR